MKNDYQTNYDTFSRLISIKESIKRGYFGKTKEETIRNWIKTDEIPASCTKKIGRRYFFIEHQLKGWIRGEKSENNPEGGNNKDIENPKKKEMPMWSEPQKKTKRCRLDMGANFFIISDPLQNGRESFRLEYLDSERNRRYVRLSKSFVKTREQAINAATREIQRMGEISRISNPYSEATNFSNNGRGYTISAMSEKFLFTKGKERIRSFYLFKTTVENRLIPFFGDLMMGELQLEQLENYRDLRREKVKDVSIKNDFVVLSMIFNFAIKRKLFTGQNPVDFNEIHLNIESRERYMTPDEQDKIWKVLENQPLLRDLAVFALNTSMRPANVLELMWNQINFDTGDIFVPASQHKQKAQNGHYVLNKTTTDLLKERKKENGNSELIFHFSSGKKISIRWVQREWKKACEKAGIENLHFYDMRHTLLSRLAADGANTHILKRISNHSSTASLEKYIKFQAMTESAVEALNRVKV